MAESTERGKQFARKLRVLQILDNSRFGKTTRELRDEVVEYMGLASLATRSIERDIRFLQENGYPIESSKTANPERRSVWKLEKHKFLKIPELPISVLELVSFAAGRELLFPLAGTPYWEGIEMLWQRFRQNLPDEVWRHLDRERSRMIVRRGGPKDYRKKEGILSAVNRAIFQHRITELWYRSLHESRPRKRTVEPYRIVLFGTSLYVVAVGASDEQRQPKSYKLDRISRAKPLDQRFQPRGDFDAEHLFSGSVGIFLSSQPRRFRVRLDKYCAPWAVEAPFHQKQTVTRRRDGGVTLEVAEAYEDEIIPRVLGLGEHAEILQPKSARAKILKVAQALVAVYS